MTALTTRLALALAAFTAVWITLGLVALRRVVRPPATLPARPPPVKPLAGADARLADNLLSFFTQDHPDDELLFGCGAGRCPTTRERGASA